MAEGAIDSAHTRFLHRGSNESNEAAHRESVSRDLAPRLEVADTAYGFRYVAIRKPNQDADTIKVVKMTRFVFPTTAVTSRPIDRNTALSLIFVPIDDTSTISYSIWRTLDGTAIDQQAIREWYHLVPGVDLDDRYRPQDTRARMARL